jgi:hypothetical protein
MVAKKCLFASLFYPSPKYYVFVHFWAMDKEQTRKKIGQKLRELRIKSGHTAYDNFAFSHDLEKSTVIRAETGRNITLDTLIDLLNIHQITLKEFFEDFND